MKLGNRLPSMQLNDTASVLRIGAAQFLATWVSGFELLLGRFAPAAPPSCLLISFQGSAGRPLWRAGPSASGAGRFPLHIPPDPYPDSA